MLSLTSPQSLDFIHSENFPSERALGAKKNSILRGYFNMYFLVCFVCRPISDTQPPFSSTLMVFLYVNVLLCLIGSLREKYMNCDKYMFEMECKLTDRKVDMIRFRFGVLEPPK